MNTKQVIVVRRDLNMRKGKIAAQVAHASMAFLTFCFLAGCGGPWLPSRSGIHTVNGTVVSVSVGDRPNFAVVRSTNDRLYTLVDPLNKYASGEPVQPGEKVQVEIRYLFLTRISGDRTRTVKADPSWEIVGVRPR